MSGRFDCDVLIVGSGFGGSVAALRLAERGLKVILLEQGRRVTEADLERAGRDALALAWAPALGRHGFLAQDVYRHLGVVRGIGVGGGGRSLLRGGRRSLNHRSPSASGFPPILRRLMRRPASLPKSAAARHRTSYRKAWPISR